MIYRMPLEQRQKLKSRPPKIAYKFFSSLHEDAIRDRGSVALGTQRSFRKADGIDNGMNDKQEMLQIFEADRDHEFSADHPVAVHLSRLDGRSRESSGVVIDKGVRFRLSTMAYIFCATGCLDKVICRRMAKIFGYDRYYRISDVDLFAQAIIDADPDLFHAHIEWVKYSDESIVSTDPMILLKPFKKLRKFAWQEEVRIYFGQHRNGQPKLFDVPGVRDLISIHKNPEYR